MQVAIGYDHIIPFYLFPLVVKEKWWLCEQNHEVSYLW